MEVQARGKTQRESEQETSAASLKLSRNRDPAGRIIGASIPLPDMYPGKHLASHLQKTAFEDAKLDWYCPAMFSRAHRQLFGMRLCLGSTRCLTPSTCQKGRP